MPLAVLPGTVEFMLAGRILVGNWVDQRVVVVAASLLLPLTGSLHERGDIERRCNVLPWRPRTVKRSGEMMHFAKTTQCSQ